MCSSQKKGSHQLQAVIRGLRPDENLLEVSVKGQSLRDRITLTNYPITGPMFSGPQQQPFVCTTTQGAVGRQPLVDTATPPGYAVTDAGGATIGYSRNCSIDTFISYFYVSTGGSLKPLAAGGGAPGGHGHRDARRRSHRRLRHPPRDRLDQPVPLQHRHAGAGAGRGQRRAQRHQPLERQAALLVPGRRRDRPLAGHGARRVDEPRRARQGIAIVHSSGNNTGTHYNLELAGETAMMTKERFVERYGVPTYTVGLGGSGGAIQQYILGQNQPGILDALLPVQSYPDMVTQTIHVGDCELLEYYMDATDRTNPKWRTTKNRTWLVGMNAEEDPPSAQRQGQ